MLLKRERERENLERGGKDEIVASAGNSSYFRMVDDKLVHIIFVLLKWGKEMKGGGNPAPHKHTRTHTEINQPTYLFLLATHAEPSTRDTVDM